MAKAQPGVWGIDVGQCALKAIRLQRVGDEIHATAHEYIEHPKILSQPDADPEQLVREALETFLSRNPIKGDKVVIGISGQSGLTRFVKLPPVEEKKIADIVKFEAKQQIPFPLNEVVWDFQKIATGEIDEETGFAMETEIGLFAIKKDNVFKALQPFNDISIEVDVVQMTPLALCNFVAYDLIGADEDEEPSCVAALDIGTDSSMLVITDGRKIIWQRPIPLGGNHFTRALTKDFKLTFAKAEHLKRNAGKSQDLKKILGSLKAVLNDFVSDLQRSLNYFTNSHRDATVKYLVGLGNAFRLPGLQRYLQEKLQLEVVRIKEFKSLNGGEACAAPTFKENVPTFALAYGLALGGLGAAKLTTNLLPNEIRSERLVRAKKPWAVATAAILLVSVGVLMYFLSSAMHNVTGAEAKKIKGELGRMRSVRGANEKQYEDLKKDIERVLANQRDMAAGIDDRRNWQLLMQYINLATPQPDGSGLSPSAKTDFYNEPARTAYKKYLDTRFDPIKQKDPELDKEIKSNMVQLSIEGISSRYTEDIPGYFRKIVDWAPQLPGMYESEKNIVRATQDGPPSIPPPPGVPGAEGKSAAKSPPTAGWIIEIRGYTYHNREQKFIEGTFLANLKDPEAMLGRPLDPELKRIVKDNVKYVFLLENTRVQNPEPGVFPVIRGSKLPYLTKSEPKAIAPTPGVPVLPPGTPGAPEPVKAIDRSRWKALAPIAAAADTAGGMNKSAGSNISNPGDGKKPARTEFIILFVWTEPGIIVEDKKPKPPGTP
jgi:type IV pilus assembly protein PilM